MEKPQLIEGLEQGNRTIIDWIEKEANGKFNEVIHEGKWTIAGHLYHLIKSQRAINYGMNINKALLWYKFGTNKKSTRSPDEIKAGYEVFLSKGFKAPEAYSAKAGRIFAKNKLIQDFESSTEQLTQSLEKWSEKKLDKYQMPHPVMGNLTIREFVMFNILHNAHHLNLLKTRY